MKNMMTFHMILVVASCCVAGGALAKMSCGEHRERELASLSTRKFVPECTPEGEYASMQCFFWAVSDRHCMCYSPDGRQLTTPTAAITSCECLSHRDRELRLQEIGASNRSFIPTCNADGTYTKMQCDSRTKACWCVDEKGNKNMC